MFLEKQLGNGCTWINLDLDKLKKLEDLISIAFIYRVVARNWGRD